GSGTSCTGTATESTETFDGFVAHIANFDGSSVPATSDPVFVDWHGAGLSLSASQNTALIGASVTLTATTTLDVGPSPFFIEIFDVTTGSFLVDCGFGTSCSATVSQAAATTHVYKAFLSQLGTSLPPPTVEETTPATYVTWAPQGWSLSLGTPVVDGLH